MLSFVVIDCRIWLWPAARLAPAGDQAAGAGTGKAPFVAGARGASSWPKFNRRILEAIAKDAGVGIGTLYRHFPKREALVEAVYEDQVGRLAASARELLARHPPAEAFRSWTALFIDWAATKHGMIDTLRALMSSGRVEPGQMRAQLVEIVSLFLSAGGAAGDLRTDVAAADVAATLAGVLAVAGGPGQRAQAGRMLDLVLDGLRPGGAGDSSRA